MARSSFHKSSPQLTTLRGIYTDGENINYREVGRVGGGVKINDTSEPELSLAPTLILVTGR